MYAGSIRANIPRSVPFPATRIRMRRLHQRSRAPPGLSLTLISINLIISNGELAVTLLAGPGRGIARSTTLFHDKIQIFYFSPMC
jgi:hypothetical protein